MTIGFDVSDLMTGRADGTTRYTRELALRLPQLRNDISWNYYSPGAFKLSATQLENVVTHLSPWPKYWTQLRLPFDLYRFPSDVLFMPIQQLPIFRPKKMKTVVVMHDLAFHHFGNQFTYKDWALLNTFSAQVAREADEIIAISQSTADDIATFYGRETNVHVIHHGVNHDRFRLPGEQEKLSSWDALHKAYPRLTKNYLLYVGQIQPRKNLVRLVKAFELVREKNSEIQLVIAGGHGWKQQEILEAIEKSPAKEHILMLGAVSDTLLPALYWHAQAFALVSLYEGFGIPILEALACGTPVVTSNVSSMPEVAGQHGILVDPMSVESIADGLSRALTEQYSSALLSEETQKFSWDKCAQETMRVLTT